MQNILTSDVIIYSHDSFISRSNLVDVKVAVSLDKFLYSTVLIGHGDNSFQILNARGLLPMLF